VPERDVDPAARGRLQEVRRNLDQVGEQPRRVSCEIHPRIVEDLGALDVIRFLADAFTPPTWNRADRWATLYLEV